jgi:hypothetical protein
LISFLPVAWGILPTRSQVLHSYFPSWSHLHNSYCCHSGDERYTVQLSWHWLLVSYRHPTITWELEICLPIHPH